MDVTNLTNEELTKLEQNIKQRKDELKQEGIKKRQQEAHNRIQDLRDNADIILPLIDRDRTSCSDTDVANGYGSADYGARCAKCHLIEILNGEWGDRFDVKLTVDITDTEY